MTRDALIVALRESLDAAGVTMAELATARSAEGLPGLLTEIGKLERLGVELASRGCTPDVLLAALQEHPPDEWVDAIVCFAGLVTSTGSPWVAQRLAELGAAAG